VSELLISAATEADMQALAAFMKAHGQANADADDLVHWYFRNPSSSASVMLGRIGERIVGMATTNDYRFRGPDGDALVAMPQKVFTDPACRGQGIFARLHWAAESACRDRGVGFFLTITNKVSTPIFLDRFGYHRLPSPRLLVLAPALGKVPSGPRPAGWPPQVAGSDDHWGMVKDAAYFDWRYIQHRDPAHLHFSLQAGGQYLGEVVMKKIRRKGLPVMLLLDVIPAGGASPGQLLTMCRRIALQQGCVAVLAMDQAHVRAAATGMARLGISSGFNLLVKGLDEAQTMRLTRQRFELAFGDLDFI
jgi:GNAT superfamily N-acetyltransferase